MQNLRERKTMTKREREDAKVFAFVESVLHDYADKYHLRLKKVSRTRPTNTRFGWCLNGEIAITVRWKNGLQLHAYALVDTMAHELAHLRYMSHSQRWMQLYTEISFNMTHLEDVYLRARRVVKRKS